MNTNRHEWETETARHFTGDSRGSRGGWMGLLMLVVMLVCLAVPAARAQQWVTGTSTGETNLVGTGTNLLTTATTAPAFALYENVDFIVMPSSTPTNVCNTNDIFGFDLTLDNTNWSNIQPIQVTNAVNNSTITTNTYTGYVVVPRALLRGAKSIRWGSQKNGHTNGATHAVRYGYVY